MLYACTELITYSYSQIVSPDILLIARIIELYFVGIYFTIYSYMYSELVTRYRTCLHIHTGYAMNDLTNLRMPTIGIVV